MVRTRLGAIGLALVWLAPAAQAGEKYRDAAHGYRVELPDRWSSVPPGVVGQLNTFVAQATKQSVTYVACFVPPGRTSSDFPKVLVQWLPWPGPPASYEQIEEALRAEVPGAMKKVEADLPVKLHELESGGL